MYNVFLKAMENIMSNAVNCSTHDGFLIQSTVSNGSNDQINTA